MLLPAEIFQDDLPPGFISAGPLNNLRLDVNLCENVSIEGVDHGAAAFQTLGIVVPDPDGAPPGNHTDSWFIFQMATDHEALREWLTRSILAPRLAEISYSFEPHPYPSWMGQLDLTVAHDGEPEYRLQGLPRKELVPKSWVWRWYYGPDSTQDYWEMEYVYDGSRGDEMVLVVSSEDSAMASLTGGVTSYSGSTALENPTYRSIRGPAVLP